MENMNVIKEENINNFQKTDKHSFDHSVHPIESGRFSKSTCIGQIFVQPESNEDIINSVMREFNQKSQSEKNVEADERSREESFIEQPADQLISNNILRFIKKELRPQSIACLTHSVPPTETLTPDSDAGSKDNYKKLYAEFHLYKTKAEKNFKAKITEVVNQLQMDLNEASFKDREFAIQALGSVEMLRKEVEDKNAEVSTKLQQICDLRSVVEQLRAENERLRIDNNNKENIVSMLGRNLSQLNTELQDKNAEVHTSLQQICDLRSVVELLQAENERLKIDSNNKEKIMSIMAENLSQLNTELRDCRISRESLHMKLLESQRRVMECSAQCCVLQDRVNTRCATSNNSPSPPLRIRKAKTENCHDEFRDRGKRKKEQTDTYNQQYRESDGEETDTYNQQYRESDGEQTDTYEYMESDGERDVEIPQEEEREKEEYCREESSQAMDDHRSIRAAEKDVESDKADDENKNAFDPRCTGCLRWDCDQSFVIDSTCTKSPASMKLISPITGHPPELQSFSGGGCYGTDDVVVYRLSEKMKGSGNSTKLLSCNDNNNNNNTQLWSQCSCSKEVRKRVVQYTCSDCEKSFNGTLSLSQHIYRVHGEKKHKCKRCNYCTSRLDHLRKHEKRSHKKSASRKNP